MQPTTEFDPAKGLWEPQPQAATFVQEMVARACQQSTWLAAFQQRLLHETGTRLLDWIDHIAVGTADSLETLGFTADSQSVYTNATGIFPKVVVAPELAPDACRLGILVDRIEDFLAVHQDAILQRTVLGAPHSQVRIARVELSDGGCISIVERHGSQSMQPDAANLVTASPQDVRTALESFRQRDRDYDDPKGCFQSATRRFLDAQAQVGTNLACDLFFQAEREYWQSKNRAARVQYKRQQALGMGWANHDHHTYRCSRVHFKDLVSVLETMGFVCRERFYAGKDAGWGAQVLEHPDCGIVIFADVDLSEDEVMGDFPHEGLSTRDELGTVGLWCELHGDSFTSAGMHHLECQFDFVAARDQLAACGIETMAPFTDFPHLKQAFTRGEMWPVPADRIQQLATRGILSADDAARMIQEGVLGSHLEILERNDGFKGFNQTGISQIIRDTNPSHVGRQ